ncbi:MAG: aminoacyl-histidine dipeptidase, partial [Bacteroidetes bacterium]|nr:aminoacyl-histidine dipeptidase [Bacteroidota bacterium]
IPRPSKKEEKVIEYLINFAKNNSLQYFQDEIGNVIITKPATKGMENSPITILQSHIDMVCEKNSDVDFDFDNDPIQTFVEDGWVKAKGTTLGADCGIGVAITMAILTSKDIAHPAIEALFTVDEETGMTGANNLTAGVLKGKYLINIDSEDEGEIFVGCAGGVDTLASFSVKNEKATSFFTPLRLQIKGLQGGHSGDDINKGFANANRLLVRFFFEQWENFKFEISKFDGGNLRNAIPREAYCDFAVSSSDVEVLAKAFKEYTDTVKAENSTKEPTMELTIEPLSKSFDEILDSKLAHDIICSMVVIPNGVVAMSQDIANFVETSTNLASVKHIDDKIVVVTSQRSSVESRKNSLAQVLNQLFTRYGAEVEHSDGYPGWTPIPSSELLNRFCESYKRLFGKEIAVKAVHAGLECGLILEKYPNLEMVSVGPTIRRVHSPDEMVDIKTVDMFWELMVDTLKTL